MNRLIPARHVCAATVLAAGLALAGVPAAVAAGESEFNEKEFMTMTVDHHFGGVRVAQTCVDKATRADLKGLCQKIEDAQSEEISKLRSHLKAWYSSDETPSVPANTKPMLDKLSGLSGRAFDVEVSRDFIQHHREFLPEADKCRKHARHEELRVMCDKMYKDQSEEIDQFEAVIAGKSVTADTGQGGLSTASAPGGSAGMGGWLAAGGVAAALGTAAVGRRLRHQ
ncbi:DUF305 domain-containing protein [Streptomyces sp. NBC_00160]|uniref:DUF305 domain-containing protein n=1 Tax=Streptomyces sp. NBC_00160 TaxID=2903628 RepID=UPI0022518CA9|nr:DUF305 domain-containing protein [Streptomyces sp. NBC_00160]MCX5302779.1 DUF305 domain-containing protein [Streptomyces sp. NBC_00160]